MDTFRLQWPYCVTLYCRNHQHHEDQVIVVYELCCQKDKEFSISHVIFVNFNRNALLRLDLSDLHELEKTEWPASNLTRKICQAKGKDEVRKNCT